MPLRPLSTACQVLLAPRALRTHTSRRVRRTHPPFDGVPGFSSQFSCWSWASALPRLVLASRTSFSKFLRSSMCIRDRGQPASDSALFPLPVLDLSVFKAGPALRSSSDGLQPLRKNCLLPGRCASWSSASTFCILTFAISLRAACACNSRHCRRTFSPTFEV